MTDLVSAPEPAWLRTLEQRAHEAPMVTGLPEATGRASAVLMLFGQDESGGQDVVLTERSTSLRKHAGQVSFPGGRVDPGDVSFADTALREAHEEIGLDREGVRVVGVLPALPLSVTGFRVTPIAAWWERPSPIGVVDTAEVARVERVSLASLVDPANRFSAIVPGREFVAPAFEVDGLYVWGFTAILLDATLRLAGLEQPWDRSDQRPVPSRYLQGG
ncbi:coenzyme A pyrophosphatase [Flexivirga endophytica]|uniref:Coenzyme A pyrophosphatase n=1 Tax=Flexivirga endophytica TaxID=1849103 RepID=A0A916T1Y5_9MICO|nr:CoA pyrophosphatase [Flexivirga endophytica]GGB26557.1 coenzyme A pyrophosphatase [Flexivirga endophytica]GHB55049.1 coenzyme A pyrophosphatase [Flexivirga endophytica]